MFQGRSAHKLREYEASSHGQVLGSLRPRRRQPERRRAVAVHPGPRQPPATFYSSPAPTAASRPSLSPSCSSASGLPQLPPRYVKVNCAPPVRSFPLFSLRAHHQRQSSPPVPRTGRAMFCNVFTFLPRPSDALHRKQPQRSAPAHQTPRGSRQRAGIAARGLALPRRQQRDEVVDKWRQAQQPPPARHQRAGN